MKIAFFSDLFLPRTDGVSSSLFHLIKHLDKQNHQILIITPKMKNTKPLNLKNSKLCTLPSMPAFLYPETQLSLLSPKMIRELKKFKPDILHLATPGPTGQMGLVYGKIKKIAMVSAFHGYMMQPEVLEMFHLQKMSKLLDNLLWKLTQAFYNNTDCVITPCKAVKKDLLEHDFVKPIKIINNAVNLKNFAIDPKLQKKFASKYLSDVNKNKLLLYIGRLSLEKKLKHLIKILKLVVDQDKDIKLLLVGDGPMKKNLIDLSTKLGLTNHIFFTGKIEYKELIQTGIYQSARLFVTCSTSEVQPVSLIEAMNYGLPIVAANARGINEMIDGNGYLIDFHKPKLFAQKTLEIINDHKLHAKFSKKSKQIAKRYKIETISKQHIALYQKLKKEKKYL